MFPANLFWAGTKLAVGGALVVAVAVVLGPARSAPREVNRKPAAGKFDARLLEIARSYEVFGRVDDRSRWAPAACDAPPTPAMARFSASKDKGTHGLKVYSLFAGDRMAYRSLSAKGQPVGQVLVKQSWLPEVIRKDGHGLEVIVRQIRLPASDGKGKPRQVFDRWVPYAQKDGKLYKAVKQSDLFIMYKLDPGTPGTDNGWVYGTVTADGKQVTSAGKVASCMKCHQKARNDRMFGLSSKP
jgi:hypothetical protein